MTGNAPHTAATELQGGRKTMIEAKFEYQTGKERPQVVLLGNGVEMKSGQKGWKELLRSLIVDDSFCLTKDLEDNVPFPLLYQILSTQSPAPAHLSAKDIQEEEQRLAEAMKALTNCSNIFLDQLPGLDADHIMTTNYSYCIEKAFFPNLDFANQRVRGQHRFCLAKKKGSNMPPRERDYRLHSGYLAQSANRTTGIWHIHGECCTPRGIVLSHDRYGRLLRRIESICENQRYSKTARSAPVKQYNSWPELFLHGDVYILGLGLEPTEFDLWWLIRRKQRERYSAGKIYFYEREPLGGFTESKHLLMKSSGIELCSAGCTRDTDYDDFYMTALYEIKERIAKART